MKKHLLFALALIAGALAFVSCEKDPADSLVGKWSFDTEKSQDGFYETVSVIFDNKGGFVFQGEQHYANPEAGQHIMLMEGTYKVNGDVITVHYTRHGWNHNGQIEYVPNWEEYDEEMKYSISGNKLTLTRRIGDSNPHQEVYTKQ